MIKRLILATLILAILGRAVAVPVPVIYASDPAPKWSLGISAGSYGAGAAYTENYGDAEHLKVKTDLRIRSGPNSGSLVAKIDSEVVGKAHIGWISSDPSSQKAGRLSERGKSVEELTGVFSIEKFIQLWENDSQGQASVDWLSC